MGDVVQAMGLAMVAVGPIPPTDIWPRGVTVSTLDSESSDRGSNPREALDLHSDCKPLV